MTTWPPHHEGTEPPPLPLTEKRLRQIIDEQIAIGRNRPETHGAYGQMTEKKRSAMHLVVLKSGLQSPGEHFQDRIIHMHEAADYIIGEFLTILREDPMATRPAGDT